MSATKNSFASSLEKEIIRFVKENCPVRKQIIRHDFHPATSKQVQAAFTKLRRAGIIYKVDDGWYQTNFSGRKGN